MNIERDRGMYSALEGAGRFYENEIPSFAQTAMERLYENTFSSPHAEHVRRPGTSTYIASRGAVATAVILFERRRDSALVLNSAVQLDVAATDRFAACLFQRYPDVRSIRFRSVALEGGTFRFPCQQFRVAEDIVLALPGGLPAYVERLGKSAAARLQYASRRVERVFPDFHHEIHEAGHVDPELVQAVLDLKARRSTCKGARISMTPEHRAWMHDVVAAYGFVTVSRIGGKVCAGAICTRIGNNYFMHVVAHEPALDQFSLGIVNSYLTIRAAIARHGREFHFLWGASDWKSRFLGEPRSLYDVVMYRSRRTCVLCARTVLACTGQAWRWRARTGLSAVRARCKPADRLASSLIARWHRLRGLLPRPAVLSPPPGPGETS